MFLPSNLIVVGRLGAPYGLKGWQRLQSFTDPIDNILDYKAHLLWQVNDEWQPLAIEAIKADEKGYLIKLKAIDSPEVAKKHSNAELAVAREYLAKLKSDEFYCSDLIGLNVIDQNNQDLGTIVDIIATGSNDVLVVVKDGKRQLVPYLSSVVEQVDLSKKWVKVNWVGF